MREGDGQDASGTVTDSGARTGQLHLSRGLVLIALASLLSALLWATIGNASPGAGVAGLIEAWAMAG